jgi:phosphatidyl-myo-inositol dimannoside synthase
MPPNSFRSCQSQALATDNSVIGVLGLFPFLDDSGGIQRAGRLAWKGIVNRESPTPNGELGRAYLFCYGSQTDDGRSETENGQEAGLTSSPAHEAIRTASKLEAVVAAAKWRQPVGLVLVWHVGLLRLLPFFRFREAKIALFLHGIEAWKPQDWLTRILLRRVDLFLSNSDYTWQRFLLFNPELKDAAHQTVHLGIGSPLNGGVPEVKTTPVALMISRLAKSEDYKGHREMIDAWPLVLERVPSAELWIVGGGSLRRDLERLTADRGLRNKIRFRGWISEINKQEMLPSCRCLALPSRGEGFGLVYLEAMRLGRPCLVSSVDAGREVVNPPEAGLAADPGNPQALSDAICRLITPGAEWEAWSEQARRRYEQYFTAHHFQERLIRALSPLTA